MAAEISKGYVFVARDILASTLWQRRPEDRIAAITAIILANHQPHKWCDGQNDVTISRGQFARSWPNLSKLCNLSPKQTRTSFGWLEHVDFLARKTAGRYSIYTIHKYNHYQDRDRYGREKDLPSGAVLLARRILDSDLWKMSAQDRVVAITCLLSANYAPGIAENGSRGIQLERGQLSAPWEKLGEWCQLEVEKTQESVGRLLTCQFLTKEVQDGVAVFTIPKYSLYQDPSKYAETPGRPKASPTGQTELPFKEPTLTGRPAGSRQEAGSIPAGARQEPGRSPAANKNPNNLKKGEEGGSAPPVPELFASEPRGAAPPLPPDAELARVYQEKFPGVMGWAKALNQAAIFLSRGGRLVEGLAAIKVESRQRVAIWKILDPLLEMKAMGAANWVPPEEPVKHDQPGVQEGHGDHRNGSPGEVPGQLHDVRVEEREGRRG